MLSRRNLLTAAAAVPLTAGLGRGLAAAAQARKQIKITGLGGYLTCWGFSIRLYYARDLALR